MGILFLSLTNLHALDIPDFSGAKYINRIVSRIARKEPPYDASSPVPMLSDIMHASFDSDCGMFDSCLGRWLPIASVRRLFMHRIGSDFDDARLISSFDFSPNTSSNVTHIELKNCCVDPQSLHEVLSLPKALDHFIYELGGEDLSRAGTVIYNFTQIRDAIDQQRSTLENLWLDEYDPNTMHLPSDWGDSVYDYPSSRAMESFVGFAKLKHFRVDVLFIFGSCPEWEGFKAPKRAARSLVQLLPQSIERLRLTHCEIFADLTKAALNGLLQHKIMAASEADERTNGFAGLYEIVLEAPFYTGHHEPSPIDSDDPFALGRLARDASINLKLFNNRPQDKPIEERKWGMDEDIVWAEASEAEKDYFPREGNKRPPFTEMKIRQTDDRVVSYEPV